MTFQELSVLIVQAIGIAGGILLAVWIVSLATNRIFVSFRVWHSLAEYLADKPAFKKWKELCAKEERKAQRRV